MFELKIPGAGTLRLKHLVFDFNGTLAVDGHIRPGVREKLRELARDLEIHVITADTFGKAKLALEDVPCRLTILPSDEPHDEAKFKYVQELGPQQVAAIGNGRNDVLMLEEAALGIAVLLEEGTAREALLAADILVRDPLDALDLFLNPLRLKATLRR
ncbi:MAG: HAD hydrolase family protein [Thermodesulfobacteria bacterium]|nr:HAD hydrolase family protein [Thermodesulfobacteriota bacterium]